MVENPLHGRKKTPRGKVRHEIFDKAKRKHLDAFRDLAIGSLEKDEKLFASVISEGSESILLQFHKGKPVGYTVFRAEPDVSHTWVHRIFVHPDYRDTEEVPRISASLFAGKAREILKNRLYKELRGIEKKKFDGIEKEFRGIKKRGEPKHLAAKMLRYLAKHYGKPLRADALGASGAGIVRKYIQHYNKEFFKRRGKRGQKKRL